MSQATTRALLISTAVHAIALSAFVALRFEPWLNGPPQPIRVWLQHDVDAETDGVRTAESARRRSAREIPNMPLPPPRPAPPRVDGAAPSGAEASTPLAELRPPVKPKLGDLEPPASALEPVRLPGDAIEPLVSRLVPSARVAVEPPSLRASIPDRERAMLDSRLARLARHVDEGTPSAPIEWVDDGRRYTAVLEHVPAAQETGLDELVVNVDTRDGGRRFSTEIRMTRLAFSSFAQLIDRWDPSVQIHDDTIDGRFHSNSEIYVNHSRGVQPAFLGPVTTARGINTSYSERPVRRDEIFLGGLDTRAGRIEMLQRFVPFADEARNDPSRVQRFGRDARIVFAADGTYTWRETGSTTAGERVIGDRPHYLIGAKDVVLHVSGTVNGSVLVYSPSRIVIAGDLLYASPPGHAPGSDDYLGLVSQGRVEIAGPETTGPGDLDVHAAIYANRRFAVTNHRHRGQATLRILGSVTAGSLTATQPRYRTHVTYDARLDELRPPGFPLTDRYRISDWDGRWVIEPPRPSQP